MSLRQNSWFESLLPLAAMLGSAIAGKGIERWGRRVVIIATAFPFIVGWIGIASSSLLVDYHSLKIFVLFLGRILTGA